MSITHSTIKHLSKVAKLTSKQQKRSERLEVGSGSKGIGSMKIICLPSGSIRIYYTYRSAKGKQVDYPLGELVLSIEDKKTLGGEAYTLSEARHLVQKAAQSNYLAQKEGYAGLREANFRHESDEDISLRALMETYINIKEEEGKLDFVKDVRSVCGRYLFKEPLVTIDANKVDKASVAKLLRAVSETGKKRTYQKLRSFLLAAYNMAIDAEYDEGCDSRLIKFSVTEIPISKNRKVDALRVNKRERYLNQDELKAVWSYLDNSDSYLSDFVKLKLLTGQRTVQLLRVKFSDINEAEKCLTLYDPKGKRTVPRTHLVAMDSLGWALVMRYASFSKQVSSKYIFTNSNGNPMTSDVVYRFVKQMSAFLVKDGSLASGITVSDLRRTWETHAARLGVSKDLRAQIASHGISGVQDAHYDMYDYMKEKREVASKISEEIGRLVYGGKPNVVIYRG